MTSLKTSIKTITYLSDIGCLEIQGASLTNRASQEAMKYINLLDIPLRTVDAFPIHHDKVIIVDGNTVETGSYNFSRAAARKNSENVVVLKNMPDVAAQYLEHWQDRWNKGTDWKP